METVMLNSTSACPRFAFVTLMSLTAVAGHQAAAHDAPSGWTYPLSCCSTYDCKEVAAKAISERPEGYVINNTGEVVAYADKRIRNSPDGEYHWCAHQSGIDAGQTICLFVPQRGF